MEYTLIILGAVSFSVAVSWLTYQNIKLDDNETHD